MDQNTLRWINFAFEVLQVLGVLFALWLASGIALEQFVGGGSDYDEEEFEDQENQVDGEDEMPAGAGWQPRLSRGLAVVVWLVLSGFFYLPLSDLITGLRTAVFLGIGWNEMGLSPAFNSFGGLPQNYYFLGTVILLIVVYGLVLWLGRRLVSDRPGSLFENLPLSSIERTFMLLGIAGLVYFLVNSLVTTLTWIDLPNQTAQPQGGALAFLAPALIGLLVLLLLIVWMNSSLLREEIHMDETAEDEAADYEAEAYADSPAEAQESSLGSTATAEAPSAEGQQTSADEEIEADEQDDDKT